MSDRASWHRGACYFIMLYVASVLLDALSTWLVIRGESDWQLHSEGNWLLHGTSMGALAIHAAVSTPLCIMAFVVAWRSRRVVYPGVRASFGEFLRFAPFGYQPTWLQSLYKLPRLVNALIILGICVPVALTLAHLRAALTNTLQATGLIELSPGAAHMVLRVAEVCVGLSIGFYLMYRDHRATART